MHTIPWLLSLILDTHYISEIALQFRRGSWADKHSQTTARQLNNICHIITISGVSLMEVQTFVFIQFIESILI